MLNLEAMILNSPEVRVRLGQPRDLPSMASTALGDQPARWDARVARDRMIVPMPAAKKLSGWLA